MALESLPSSREPLHGTVDVPGSKSISNRALVCAALADGTSSVAGPAEGDDTTRMIEGLRRFGVAIDGAPDGTATGRLAVHGPLDMLDETPVVIDAGLAGTTSRFLTAVAALRRGSTTITGGSGLRARPMADLHRLLRGLGVRIETERDGFLPVTVGPTNLASLGGGNRRGEIVATGGVSSQFISAVMMIAPMFGGLVIRLEGPVVSRGYLDMTADVMRRFGAEVVVDGDRIAVGASGYRPAHVEVDADWSSASYPFAAVAICSGEVTVPRLRRNGLQPEEDFVQVLERMGCLVRCDDRGVTVARRPDNPLAGAEVDMSAMSDLVPTLAVMAACAAGPSRITGVGFIRGKESDRLGDLAGELRACGVDVAVEPDGLVVRPAPVRSATVDPHDDHRLAMSLALLGLRRADVRVADPGVVGKSWPGYWTAMRSGFGLA